MKLDSEQRHLLTNYWQLLQDHYIWHDEISEIARKRGMRESDVRLLLTQAWQSGVNEKVVRDYLKMH